MTGQREEGIGGDTEQDQSAADRCDIREPRPQLSRPEHGATVRESFRLSLTRIGQM